jgi:hypothetical protein
VKENNVPTVITMLFVAVMITTSCAPQMAPYLPDYTITHHYPADKQTLHIDQPLLDVCYRYTLPVYTPVKKCQPPLSTAYPVSSLRPGQRWIAFDILDQDILILHPPNNDIQPPGIPLGLAVHRDGRLYSMQPWYDLHRQKKIPQPAWQPTPTPLFQLEGAYVIDCFQLDLMYRGMANAHLLFEKRAFKCSSAVPVSIENIYRPSQAPSTLYFQRLRVDIQSENGDGINRVNATVNKIRPDRNND